MAKKRSSGGKASGKARKRSSLKPSGKKKASKKAAKKKPSRRKSSVAASRRKTPRKKTLGKATKKGRGKAPREKSIGKKTARKAGKRTAAGTGRGKTARKKAARRGKVFFEHFRNRLLEERERIGRRLDDLRDELSGLQEMPRELEEWAQEEKDRDILIRLEEREATELRRIQAALERIDDGSYGLCQICGRPIPRDRLEELPTAFRCIDHTA